MCDVPLLVGGFNPSEKYESVGTIIPNIWENKNRSKPPKTTDFLRGHRHPEFPHAALASMKARMARLSMLDA